MPFSRRNVFCGYLPQHIQILKGILQNIFEVFLTSRSMHKNGHCTFSDNIKKVHLLYAESCLLPMYIVVNASRSAF
jgi:hypothetical protein